MASARTVAVVVPSPAASLVFTLDTKAADHVYADFRSSIFGLESGAPDSSKDAAPGSDTVPAGTYDLGYGAEVRWNISALTLNNKPLEVGHTYRFYFMVHDGDQNKVGGDTGQGCLTVCFEQ